MISPSLTCSWINNQASTNQNLGEVYSLSSLGLQPSMLVYFTYHFPNLWVGLGLEVRIRLGQNFHGDPVRASGVLRWDCSCVGRSGGPGNEFIKK